MIIEDSQNGRRAICGGMLFAVEDRPLNPRQLEKWRADCATIIPTETQQTQPVEKAEPRLVHAECRRGLGPELRNACEPAGLA